MQCMQCTHLWPNIREPHQQNSTQVHPLPRTKTQPIRPAHMNVCVCTSSYCCSHGPASSSDVCAAWVCFCFVFAARDKTAKCRSRGEARARTRAGFCVFRECALRGGTQFFLYTTHTHITHTSCDAVVVHSATADSQNIRRRRRRHRSERVVRDVAALERAYSV